MLTIVNVQLPTGKLARIVVNGDAVTFETQSKDAAGWTRWDPAKGDELNQTAEAAIKALLGGVADTISC